MSNSNHESNAERYGHEGYARRIYRHDQRWNYGHPARKSKSRK